MIRRLLLSAILAAVAGNSEASTIAQVTSPTQFVLAGAHRREVMPVSGTPVYYCGLDAFTAWAAPLVGQRVESTPGAGVTVSIDARNVPLEHVLVEQGWLQPAALDDAAQAAIAEGRGGWACASPTTPFQLMRTSIDPKVLAGVALNESGRDGRAWPWTLNVAGRGFFFRSRADAYGAMRILLAQGRCDFDVGLMQINWCYHAQRFASPRDALAPATNIRVAEDILNGELS